jgi:predicted nucleotidyltransferase
VHLFSLSKAHFTNNSAKVWNFRDFLLHLQTEQFMLTMNRETMTRKIAEYFKTQPVLKAWLFGSFARGEETPESDVDILVEFDQNSRVSLMKHAGMIVDLEQKLNRPIDLVVNGTLLPFATKSAERDKILIYERAN